MTKKKKMIDSSRIYANTKERVKNPLFLGRFWGCVEIFRQAKTQKCNISVHCRFAG